MVVFFEVKEGSSFFSSCIEIDVELACIEAIREKNLGI